MIVIAYGELDEAELAGFEPVVVRVDAANRILSPSHASVATGA